MIEADELESIILEQYPNLYEALKRQNYYSWEEALEELADLINSFQVPDQTNNSNKTNEGKQE